MKLSTITKDRIKKDNPENKRGDRNPVAKNLRGGLNKSVKMKDRKRAAKRGKVKHKKKMFETTLDIKNIWQ